MTYQRYEHSRRFSVNPKSMSCMQRFVLSLLPYLVLLFCSHSHLCVHGASHSKFGGDVLSPPPPPPPPRDTITHLPAKSKDNVPTESIAIRSSDDVDAIIKPNEKENYSPDSSLQEDDQEMQEQKKQLRGFDPSAEYINDAAKEEIIRSRRSGQLQNQSDTFAKDFNPQKHQQQLQQHYLAKEVPYFGEQSAQFSDQYNVRSYQQSQYESRELYHRQQHLQQQQQQQQYPQKIQHYPDRYPSQNLHSNPQGRQLAASMRPYSPASSSPSKASASRILSLAMKKLQNGIGSVPKVFETSKVTSSTSRLGDFGDTVTSVVEFPNEKTYNGTKMHISKMGQRQMPPHRQILGHRSVLRAQETYAPPPSELFPSGHDKKDYDATSQVQMDNVERNDLWREKVKIGEDFQQSSLPDDHTKSDSETEHETEASISGPTESLPNMISSLHPYADELSISRLNYGRQQNQRFIQMKPSRPVVESKSSQSWPNGGSVSTSSMSYPPSQVDSDDDFESSSIGHKMKSILRLVPIPNIHRLFLGFRSSSNSYDDAAWSDDESKDKCNTGRFSGLFRRRPSSTVSSKPMLSSTPSLKSQYVSSRSSSSAQLPQPILSLLKKRDTLLSPNIAAKCASIGRTLAVLDIIQLACLIFAAHEVLPSLLSNSPHITSSSGQNSVANLQNDIRLLILSNALLALNGWAPYAIVTACLISLSNSAWISPAFNSITSEAALECASEATFAQLYLRLISSRPTMETLSPTIVKKATQMQALNTASISRLQFFITLVIFFVLLSTVAVLQPAITCVFTAMIKTVCLDEWKKRPIDWSAGWELTKTIGSDLFLSLHMLFYKELDVLRRQPLHVVVVVSLLVALISISYMPSLEKWRLSNQVELEYKDDSKDDLVTNLWFNIGSSSAARLALLSSPHGVEGALKQFSKLNPDRAAALGLSLPENCHKLTNKGQKKKHASSINSFHFSIRKLTYALSSFIVLSAPLLFHFYVLSHKGERRNDSIFSITEIPLNGWVSLFDMTALLLMTNLQVGRAVSNAMRAANVYLQNPLTVFFSILKETVHELQTLSATCSATDFRAMLTMSPIKGIAVSDFWVAHASQKAWALKGVNLHCRNGEVVLLIGPVGAGKSRLLTAIAELIFQPPKSARTTKFVRGSIHVGGVDHLKWDHIQLQKRVGLFLNDIHMLSAFATLASGSMLEEILEPLPVTVSSMKRSIGVKEKNAIILAMKITSLSSMLSSYLPSKLATVVSANEDELRLSPLHPQSYPLSPSDWSKVFLTKILAQLISGSDQLSQSPNAISNCLLGSILLLDDATSLMSEVDEANFITSLRSTGAAVVLSSNRWAAGRLADRIFVIENGSIVESGTHADLINLGPEKSLYARQWQIMTSL